MAVDEPRQPAVDVRVRPEDGPQDDVPQEPDSVLESEVADEDLEDLVDDEEVNQ
jgi:hypothetical protein